MARRLTGLPRAVRQARLVTYGASRFLGNAQPFVDLGASGRFDIFGSDLLRRTGRRLIGRAFSQSQFGRGSIIKSIAGLCLGRFIGRIGRF